MKNTLPESINRSTAIYLCFLLSGAAGLIYEVLWAKYLSLYVGSTGLAQIIVLSTFMGGMALGSYILGKVADQVENPLRLYAYVELAVGLYALIFEWIYTFSHTTFISAARMTNLTPGSLIGWKFMACVMTILLPAALMGGTLPLLGRYMIRSSGMVGPRISRLYFLNSLGGVIGCLLAGFYLIQSFGLSLSMIFAACLNFLVAVIALGFSNKTTRITALNRSDGISQKPIANFSPTFIALMFTAAGVSGAVSMIYEVSWVRLLTLVLGSSTYSFSLMLGTFILGLSIGGALLSMKRSPTGYTGVFAVCSIGVGLTVLIGIPAYVRLPYWFNQLASHLSREPNSFQGYQMIQLGLCSLVMIVPTILQGVTLPAATKVLAEELPTLGRRIGTVFAVNTVGTLTGIACGSFWGLPKLGVQGTIEFAVILNILLGLVVLGAGRFAKVCTLKTMWFTVGAVIIVISWYVKVRTPWDQDVFSIGTYRTRTPIESYDSFIKEAKSRETIFYVDGIDSTIAVQETPFQRMLVVNGKVDASTGRDLATQKTIAHLPMLLREQSNQVFIVGVGSGATIGSVLTHDPVQIDVAELSQDIVDASRLFDSINNRYWEDKRVNLYIEDAKTFLQLTQKKYDVIISEPTNPWIAGIANVFSQEFYEMCKDHLRESGIFVQWIQLYELEDPTFFLMLETFRTRFPYFTLWNANGGDLILVGSPTPFTPNFKLLLQKFNHEKVRADFETFGVNNLLSLLATQLANYSIRGAHARWAEKIHTDHKPVLEYLAPRGFFTGSFANGILWLDARRSSPANANLWMDDYLKFYQPSAQEFRDTYNWILSINRFQPQLALAWAAEWARRYPQDTEAQEAIKKETESTPYPPLHNLLEQCSDNIEIQQACESLNINKRFADYLRSKNYLHITDAEVLLTDISEILEKRPGTQPPKLLYAAGQLQFDLGRYTEAAKTLEQSATVFQLTNQEMPLIISAIVLCRTHHKSGNMGAAQQSFNQFLLPYVNNFKVWRTREEIFTLGSDS